MSTGTIIRRKTFIAVRLVLLVCVSLWLAHFINHKNYDYYFNKLLLRIHTDLRTAELNSVLPSTIENLLVRNQREQLQEVVNRNYSVFALVITDCRLASADCPDQKIIMTTTPSLLTSKLPRPEELVNYPFVPLQLPVPPSRDATQQAPRPIIGRVYTISTMPASFEEDYHRWLRDPFADYSLWKIYLATTVNSVMAAVLIWAILELFIKIKWMQQKTALDRERLLIANADKYLRQLEDKEGQIAEQEKMSRGQFQVFIERIRELETRLRHDKEQQLAAEAIIESLEQESESQVARFREQLEETTRERTALQKEVAKYRQASGREKEQASRTLASALSPSLGNRLEQEVQELLASSPKGRSGAWAVLHQVDVALGKEVSRFIDSMVISKDCLMIIEAKNYSGRVFAEGDAENTRWHCQAGNRPETEIKGSWGVNPYHQVREYVMALLTVINTRGSWRLPVYGVIVFPGGADLSEIGDRIGKFYRVTTSDRLLAVLDNLDAEARRENAHTKRPQPLQIEELILGRRQGKAPGKSPAR